MKPNSHVSQLQPVNIWFLVAFQQPGRGEGSRIRASYFVHRSTRKVYRSHWVPERQLPFGSSTKWPKVAATSLVTSVTRNRETTDGTRLALVSGSTPSSHVGGLTSVIGYVQHKQGKKQSLHRRNSAVQELFNNNKSTCCMQSIYAQSLRLFFYLWHPVVLYNLQ